MIDDRYSPPKTPESASRPEPTPVLQRGSIPIGGWLIVVAFGLIITPFRIVHLLFTNFLPILADGHWQRLTHAGGAAYHVLWGPLIIFELAGNMLLFALGAVTLALFFKRSRRTPKFAIALYAIGPAYILADRLFGNFIPAVANSPDSSDMKEMVRATMNACIWIPYFLVSDRVKRTFTL